MSTLPKCRLDYRNGYYFRDFLTQLGRLAGVRIPRTRKGFRSQVLPRYRRRQAAVDQLIRQAFLRGISTRQVSDVLQPMLGESYSAQTISNITRQLDTAVQQFRRGPLADEYLYLFLDGIVLKVRDTARKVRRRMILVAYGVTRTGLRRVLAYQFAQDESQAAWEQHWQHRRPNAVACVERDLDALLNFFAAPPAHWIKVRTTNVIERAFG